MDVEIFNPFDPRSPEGLIYQFRVTHCSGMSYLSCEQGSDVKNIRPDSFNLQFDKFLRSVRDFNPLRAHFLSDGPHVYIRQFLDAYMPDDREKAELRSFIANAMLSKTMNAMGIIADFIEFSSKEAISRAIAEGLPRSRQVESHEERQARWKGYWKCLQDIEKSFKAIVAIHEMALEKRDVSRIFVRRGPKPVLWKYDFAYWIGRLWFNLFSTIPSSSPDSRFAEFLESIWASIDPDDLHPQNWDRTIRDVVDAIKSALNQ
jgi:hypothetical protein